MVYNKHVSFTVLPLRYPGTSSVTVLDLNTGTGLGTEQETDFIGVTILSLSSSILALFYEW